MKVVFREISLKNFKSFRGEHSFSIGDKGLHLVSGDNVLDGKLGTNGVGKTSLFESIFYVFNGKTSQGLKKNDIISWGESDYYVSIDIMLDDTFYSLTKADQLGTSIYVESEKETLTMPQEQLYSYLGLPEQFLYSVVFSQFQPGFFELKPTERLNYFCEVFNFDIWDTYKEKAKNQNKSLSLELAEKEKLLAFHEGWLGTILSQKTEINEKNEEWETERASQKKNIAEKVHQLNQDVSQVASEEVVYKETLEEIKSVIKPIEKQKEKLSAVIKAKQVLLAELQVDIKVIENRLGTEEEGWAQIDDMKKGSNCSQCGQRISADLINNQERAKNEKIALLNKEYDEMRQVYKYQQSAYTVLVDDDRKLHTKYAVATKNLQDIFATLESLQEKRGWLQTQIRQEKEKALPDNPFSQLLKNINASLRLLPRRITIIKESLIELQAEKEILDYWEKKGFKGIKLSLIQTISKNYEILVNSYLRESGLQNWDISINMQKELKSGGFKPQFDILINSGEQRKNGVPLHSCSGGELQRLKLAGNLALADLMSFWNNIETNLLVIDEYSQHLSESGIRDILQIFSEKSQQKAVYIIEHGEFKNKGDFGGFVKIRKTQGGSEIAMS